MRDKIAQMRKITKGKMYAVNNFNPYSMAVYAERSCGLQLKMRKYLKSL